MTKLKKPVDDRIMSPRELFNKLFDCNAYDLLAFLVWYTKRKDFRTCKDCIEWCKSSSGIKPDCSKCGLPTARLLQKHFKEDL